MLKTYALRSVNKDARFEWMELEQDSGASEPDVVRVGKLGSSRTSSTGLQCDRSAQDATAVSVAVFETQGEIWEVCMFPRSPTVGEIRSGSPCENDSGPSAGEDMILSESPMRENRVFGLMSRGEETRLRLRLRH